MEPLASSVDPSLIPAAALLVGLLFGGALAWWLASGRARGEAAALAERLRLEMEGAAALAGERLESARREGAAAVADRDRLRAELEEMRRQIAVLSDERGRFEELAEAKNHQIARLEKSRAEVDEERRRLAETLTEREKALSTATTRLEEQERANAERLKQLEEAKEKMAAEFENLANRILEEKGKKFAEQNRTGIDTLLTPLREQLDGFRAKVEEIHRHDTSERGALTEQLRQLRELNRRIGEDAVNLTRALKGDKKAQGNWGEMILERVLEESGLRKGHEYQVQGSFRDAEGKLLRPDVVIQLPDDKQVVVDSKVSLLAYTEYVNAANDAEREVALRAHVEAVRNHIKGLAEKHYSALPGLHSPDFVLMFMPIEPAFMAAFEGNDRLFSEAFDNKIVVVTPTTLLATLRTVESIWRNEQRNKNAQEIANMGGKLYDKLRGFVEDMEQLGGRLESANKSYDAAMNKLTEGRDNLIRQAERFVELGVKVKKPISAAMIERAGVEHEESEA